jgi:two-component system NtrC family sensor kinase
MFRSGIRSKLMVGFALAVVVQGVITGLVGVRLFYDRMIAQARSEVGGALGWAREIYRGRLDEIKNTVRLTATRSRVVEAARTGDRAFLAEELANIRKAEGLDILTITDAQGRVLVRARNPDMFGDDLSSRPLIRAALTDRQSAGATVVMSRDELLREGPDLANRAYIWIVDTPMAKPRSDKVESEGMMLASVAPVLDRNGALAGVLFAAHMLNHDPALVDKIKETAFGREMYRGRDVGTATIFLGDVRVATNVRNDRNERAVGTRLSRQVNEAVLGQGRRWIDEAFVVNDWYITAYEPIRDFGNRVVGILYVGLLKRPYSDSLWETLSIFIGIALLGIALVIVVAALLAGSLTRPLRDMVRLTHRVTEGDENVEIKVESKDEIGQLAEAFNTMTAKLAQVLGELRDWNRTLEQKVEERSREIKAMQSQLIQSEKLASLGKLAAGVAHEINNPMTGILTNASLLLEDLPPEDPTREDLQTIVDETIRCRRIVKGLLDFSRQSQPEKKRISLNEIARNSLALLRNQASFRNIEFVEELDPYLPEISADPNQLQQVFINMLINASEAMHGKGRIHIVTRRADRLGESVEAMISDSGPGIPPDMQSKLFDPFFTTKATGTGLGLAVSYGIIERHNGTIDVKSEPGQGAVFIIRLPVAAEPAAKPLAVSAGPKT